MHSNIYEMLIAKKNVLEAAVEDIKHDLYSYELLQRNLHISSTENFVNFSATFMKQLRR